MSFANKYNKNTELLFNINCDGFDYKKLSELDADTTYTLRGVFVSNKSKFGESAVAICDNFFVNLPNHMINTVREILSDAESIDDINNSKVGFTVYQYHSDTYNKDCYSIKFVDIVE